MREFKDVTEMKNNIFTVDDMLNYGMLQTLGIRGFKDAIDNDAECIKIALTSTGTVIAILADLQTVGEIYNSLVFDGVTVPHIADVGCDFTTVDTKLIEEAYNIIGLVMQTRMMGLQDRDPSALNKRISDLYAKLTVLLSGDVTSPFSYDDDEIDEDEEEEYDEDDDRYLLSLSPLH